MLDIKKICLNMQRMNKSLFPEAVLPGKAYSFWADLKLTAWALVALAVALLTRWLLHDHPGWGAPFRASLALAPLLPSLLWMRSLARWIGSMDELQRCIQLGASLFAAVGTLFAATALSLLNGQGISVPRLDHGLGWEGTFACVVALYLVGNWLFNRRFR